MKGNIELKPESFPRTASDSVSDTEIATAAYDAIQWLTTISPETINISVHDGWVDLDGTVEWWHQRDTLSDVVRHVPGVKGFSNLVTLKSEASAPNSG